MSNSLFEPAVTIIMDYDGSIRSRKYAARFFDEFAAIYPELHFSLMGEWEPLRRHFDPNRSIIEWEENRTDPGHVRHGHYIFAGKEPGSFFSYIDWFEDSARQKWADSIGVMFSEAFWSDKLISKPTERAIDLLKALSSFDNALYGRAFHSTEFEAKGFANSVMPDGQTSRQSISLTSREGLLDIFWANYFGKAYVELLGLGNLKLTESLVNEPVGEGFLIVTSPDPLQWSKPEYITLQKNVRSKLSGKVFLDYPRSSKPDLGIRPKQSG